MNRLSDNYYQRKCYLTSNKVPTQSIMKEKMCPSLANVYFKSMSPKLKILAGLEPPLKGGGTSWFVPPEEILAGRPILKPIKAKYLRKLGYLGLDEFGAKVCTKHHTAINKEKEQAIIKNDQMCIQAVLKANQQHYADASQTEIEYNAHQIQATVLEYEKLLKTSLTNFETLIFDAATKEIDQVREDAFIEMKNRYKQYLNQQATSLYNEYEAKFMESKKQSKEKFIEEVQDWQTKISNIVHDLNVEKHTTIEKLRQLLECQNLSRQIYVVLKETEECQKQIDQAKYQHKEKVKHLKDDIALKDFEIQLEIEHDQKRQTVDRLWIQKICLVAKKIQVFVEYGLTKLPKYADFFLNVEKLMMLQLSEALQNPTVESIIESEQELIETSVGEPHPFYLFCDKGYKPAHVDQNLCPKHCTSNASHLPVVVVNDRYIYSACDNFEIFSEKVTQYLAGLCGDDLLKDRHNYELAVPVKYSPSMQLNELNLESSVMQILQKELVNRKKLPLECKVCKIPFCFCSPISTEIEEQFETINEKKISLTRINSGNKLKTRSAELLLQREPKWESYLEYVTSKKCKCTNIAKRHWEEHLPPYMRKMSPFEPPELHNYEPCKLETLKNIVKKAKSRPGVSLPPCDTKETRKDVCTQYEDPEFGMKCACFSDDEVSQVTKDLERLIDSKISDTRLHVVHVASCRSKLVNSSHFSSQPTITTEKSFITHGAFSLINLLNDVSQLKEMFLNRDFK